MTKRALDIWESPVPYDGLGLADITIHVLQQMKKNNFQYGEQK